MIKMFFLVFAQNNPNWIEKVCREVRVGAFLKKSRLVLVVDDDDDDDDDVNYDNNTERTEQSQAPFYNFRSPTSSILWFAVRQAGRQAVLPEAPLSFPIPRSPVPSTPSGFQIVRTTVVAVCLLAVSVVVVVDLSQC